ncbi:thiamine pyrophosphate-binding protein [Sagittula salina]|uniref:Thiamine pyrophosphate-binding protein n=1 Tax=Sagittula salina TaxID=2820268 RepID=A0A940MSE2_9RHOB|nr:thiamine pyrophosphate-binding protein [Sagittula salina]MBP0484539.1 thiamine pyrophosphate-binding protein [Sagittula salina]
MTHVFETLAQVFAREGVSDCFALLGDANMAFASALAGLGVDMTYVRHEHCAVAAATAYARKSGRTGVATVTCGPGLTQVLTALPAAVRARTPLVILAGEAPIGTAWYNQAIDQAPFVTATGARYHPLHHVPRMAEAIRDAFVEAEEERVPVVLGVPFDLQYQSADIGLPAPSADILPKLHPCPPHPDAVAQIAREIDGARRIVVMAGLGAVDSGAAEAATALADHLGALLTTTLPARGLFHGHPFHVGVAGGFSSTLTAALFEQADLVIALGCRLTQHNLAKGKLFPNARVLQVDTAPRALSQGAVPAGLHLRGDARLAAEGLTSRTAARSGWRSDRLAKAIATAVSDTATFPPEPGVHDPRDVVTALDRALPADWQMVNSSGHCSFYFAHMDRPFDRFLTIREFGAIGNGTSYAMGVARACPGDTVVLLDGDGSLLMHVQELETMRRHGLNILICVLNDRAYGSEIHKLRDEGLSEAGAVFGATDLAAIARGFGVGGETVTDLDGLPALVQSYAETGGVAVFDFPISDRVASPVIRRAHPAGHGGTEHPITVEDLL